MSEYQAEGVQGAAPAPAVQDAVPAAEPESNIFLHGSGAGQVGGDGQDPPAPEPLEPSPTAGERTRYQ